MVDTKRAVGVVNDFRSIGNFAIKMRIHLRYFAIVGIIDSSYHTAA